MFQSAIIRNRSVAGAGGLSIPGDVGHYLIMSVPTQPFPTISWGKGSASPLPLSVMIYPRTSGLPSWTGCRRWTGRYWPNP
jgi:hypothetical protein